MNERDKNRLEYYMMFIIVIIAMSVIFWRAVEYDKNRRTIIQQTITGAYNLGYKEGKLAGLQEVQK